MKKLILIGGAPGSGKSTRARQLKEQYSDYSVFHIEADQFFEKDGEYRFDPSKLSAAHRWCQKCASDNMRQIGTEVVIVSNCFTKEWEREFYLEEACRWEYEVEWLHMTGTYSNVHGVPEEKVQKIRDAFEPFTMNNYRVEYRITPYILASYLIYNRDKYPVRQLMCVFSEYRIFTECISIAIGSAAINFMHCKSYTDCIAVLCRNFERWRNQHGTSDWPIIEENSLQLHIKKMLSKINRSQHFSEIFKSFEISRGTSEKKGNSMQQIIDGKLWDTTTSKFVCFVSDTTALLQTRKGNFFTVDAIVVERDTGFALPIGAYLECAAGTIVPCSIEKAKQLIGKLGKWQYESFFGELEEA